MEGIFSEYFELQQHLYKFGNEQNKYSRLSCVIINTWGHEWMADFVLI